MSNLAPDLETLRVAALRTSVEAWAIRARWDLQPKRSVNRAGPCPVCGGNDRFYINTKQNKWGCRQCHKSGKDVISLVMHTERLEFVKALEAITGTRAADLRNEDSEAKKARQAKFARDKQANEAAQKKRDRDAEQFRQKARFAGKAIWDKSRRWNWASGRVAAYLRGRGVDTEALAGHIAPDGMIVLREIAEHEYLIEGKSADGRKIWETVHTGPAMIAAIQLPDNRFGAVHQTWLDLTASPKFRMNLVHPKKRDKNDKPVPLPSKKMLGSKKGGAMRLYTPPNPKRLVAGEGIETTLTVMASNFEPDTAYWCLADLGNMAGRAARDGDGKIIHEMPDMTDKDAFVPPEWVTEMVYLGDADAKTDAAYQRTRDVLTRGCRRAMAARPATKTSIAMAARGMDFNDMVNTSIGAAQ